MPDLPNDHSTAAAAGQIGLASATTRRYRDLPTRRRTLDDPFAHHPELAGLIADPMTSFFRGVTTAKLKEEIARLGGESDWLHSDAHREELRRATLASLPAGDLWVFAYGSLMWDPAIRFAEVRRARLADYARRFILYDENGGRGTAAAPGVMAALDACPPDDPGCEGLAFRIPAALIEDETRILWQREIIGPAYLARLVPVRLGDMSASVLTFVADHGAAAIQPQLSHDDQVRCLATGAGFLGTSFDYLKRLAVHFDALGIDDPHIGALLDEAGRLRATTGAPAAPG